MGKSLYDQDLYQNLLVATYSQEYSKYRVYNRNGTRVVPSTCFEMLPITNMSTFVLGSTSTSTSLPSYALPCTYFKPNRLIALGVHAPTHYALRPTRDPRVLRFKPLSTLHKGRSRAVDDSPSDAFDSNLLTLIELDHQVQRFVPLEMITSLKDDFALRASSSSTSIIANAIATHRHRATQDRATHRLING